MRGRKIIGRLAILLFLCTGCSQESGFIQPNTLKFYRTATLSSDRSTLLQKITSISYDKNSQSINIAFEPASSAYNLVKLKILPLKESVIKPTRPYKAQITQGPLHEIKTSPNGIFTAFGGQSRQLALLKNGEYYAEFDLDSEITSLQFNNGNVLAVGEFDGKVTLIDLENRVKLKTIQLFDGETTSLAFYKENQLLAAGVGAEIFQIEIPSGTITRKIKTRGFKERVYRLTGLKPCAKPRINRILYVKSQEKIITSHGWDYCSINRIGIWEPRSGKLIKEITMPTPKFPVFNMLWIPKIQAVILADYGGNLWKLSLNDFKLSGPDKLSKNITLEAGGTRNEGITIGNINSMTLIPDSPYFLLGAGSYFKGAPRVLLLEANESFIKTVLYLQPVRGQLSWFASAEFFDSN